MSTTPNPAATAPVPRKLTDGEIQRWINDAWVAAQVRLSPGKLNTSCANRVQVHARQNYLPLLEQARDSVFTNYQESVRLIADAYYRAVIALRFEPNALDWLVVHPSVTARQNLEIQNRGLERQADANEFDVAAKNQATVDKAKADKIERQAQVDTGVAIDKILFTNSRGIDNRKTDELRAELRAYVEEHKDTKKWSDILSYVTTKIAGAYKAHERELEQWNSR